MSKDLGTPKEDDIEEVTDEDVIAFTQRSKVPSLIPAHLGLSEEEKLRREKAKQSQNKLTENKRTESKTIQGERRRSVARTSDKKTSERKQSKNISGKSDTSDMTLTARVKVPSVIFAHKESANTKQVRRLSELARERSTALEPGSMFKTFQGETSSTNTEIRAFTKRAPVPKVIPAHRGLTEEEKLKRMEAKSGAAVESTAKLTKSVGGERASRTSSGAVRKAPRKTSASPGELETLNEEEAGTSGERRLSETRRLTVPELIPAHKDPQSSKQLRRVSEAERERNSQ